MFCSSATVLIVFITKWSSIPSKVKTTACMKLLQAGSTEPIFCEQQNYSVLGTFLFVCLCNVTQNKIETSEMLFENIAIT